MKFLKKTGLFATLLAIVANAHAGFIENRISLDQLYPDYDSVALSLGTAVVGSGIEFVQATADFDFDISNNQIRFTRDYDCAPTADCSMSYATSAFNGYRISDTDGTLPKITGIELNYASGFSSFDASRLSFDKHNNIFINLGGLFAPTQHTDVLMTVSFESTSSVPEPSSYAMFAVGLAGLGAWQLRKR